MPVTGNPPPKLKSNLRALRNRKKKLTRNDVAKTLFFAGFCKVGKVDIYVPFAALVSAFCCLVAPPKLVAGIMMNSDGFNKDEYVDDNGDEME